MMDKGASSEIEDVLELAPMQVSMLVQTLLAPASGVFVEQQVVPLTGGLDREAFVTAWQGVIDRNMALRCSFHWEGLEKPVQVAHRSAPLPIHFHDWSATPAEERRSRLEAHLAARRAAGFDLARAPLMQVDVVALANREACFIWHFHHLLLDGWSSQLILKDVVAEYLARVGRRPYRPPARRPFRDFIGWLQAQDLRGAEAFWKKTLEGFQTPTPVPIGRKPAGRFPTNPDEGRFEIEGSEAESEVLRRFCREQRVTLNTVLEGAWAVVLSRYSGEPDVLFGTVVSGRPADLPGVEGMVGLFMNVIPMRARVRPEAAVGEWLRELQRWQSEAFEHQHVTTVQMRQWSGIGDGLELYETALVFENHPGQFPGARAASAASPDAIDIGRTNLPLTVILIPGPRLRWRFLFDRGRFEPAAIERMGGHWREVLRQFTADGTGRLGDVSILTASERRQLVEDWKVTDHATEPDQTLLGLLESRCAATPQASAFLEDQCQLTFGEVWAKSRLCARALRSRGIAPGDAVAVCLPRSLGQAIAFLGVLRAGGVYVPLDPAYPTSRLEFMLRDSGAKLLLVSPGAGLRLRGGVPFEEFDATRLAPVAGTTEPQETAPRPRSGRDLACILYTSGSTGQPKGVAVEHGAILARLVWMWATYPFAKDEVACLKAPLSFVDSLWELLGGLLQGRPTAILPEAVATDPPRLIAALAAHRVTRLWVVPSFLESLLDSGIPLAQRLPALRFWVSTGEPLSRELAERFRALVPDAVLHNVYGMTEIWDATWFDPTRDAVGDAAVPIGRPLSHVRILVLDGARLPVPVGVPGELHVGGPGLARGYHNLDDLTRQRFIEDPTLPPGRGRLFRTGDRVRYREDGVLEYLGRTDFLIKLRGFRVEPGEVEAVLAECPGVRECLVVGQEHPPAGLQLVAYLVPAGAHRDTAMVMSHARRRLPSFMVPSLFQWLDALPLTPSGKRDRRALPRPDVRAPASTVPAQPRSEIERAVLGRFQEVLQVPSAGIHDHFFRDLGGHSLLATRLISRLREDFQVDLPLRSVFEAPTVAGLAAEIRRRQEPELAPEAERLLEELAGLAPDQIESVRARVNAEAGPDS